MIVLFGFHHKLLLMSVLDHQMFNLLFIEHQHLLQPIKVLLESCLLNVEDVFHVVGFLSEHLNRSTYCYSLHAPNLDLMDSLHLLRFGPEGFLCRLEGEETVVIDVSESKKVVGFCHIHCLGTGAHYAFYSLHILKVLQSQLVNNDLNLVFHLLMMRLLGALCRVFLIPN